MTARQNVLRILTHLGLAEYLVITREEPDRVWAWPVSDGLMRHVVLCGWNADPRPVASAMHGTPLSLREPRGVTPSLQICFHRVEGSEGDYYLELDCDPTAPDWRHPVQLGQHAWQVIQNVVTRRKTDQVKVSRLLDRRFEV